MFQINSFTPLIISASSRQLNNCNNQFQTPDNTKIVTLIQDCAAVILVAAERATQVALQVQVIKANSFTVFFFFLSLKLIEFKFLYNFRQYNAWVVMGMLMNTQLVDYFVMPNCMKLVPGLVRSEE